jgi:predicted small integral membrane protein
METLTLVGQAVMTALLFGWLAIGAVENIRAPAVNRDLVAAVLTMTRVRDERPEIYELVKGNRIESPRIHAALWTVIVAAEVVVALVLGAGTVALVLAALGAASAETARILAGAGAIGFTAIWGGFLVGGQWVHCWAAWKDSQFTHYLMTLWGIVTFMALT